MHAPIAIRTLFGWLIVFFTICSLGGVCARGEGNNPLRASDAFKFPSLSPEKKPDNQSLLQVGWSDLNGVPPAPQPAAYLQNAADAAEPLAEELPAAGLPPAPAVELMEENTPQNWEPGAVENDAELYWPDESYGYDPNRLRGRLRRSMARTHEWIAYCTGFGLDQSGRFVGYGSPLTNTSWLNRPWSFGAFIGTQLNDDLIAGRIDQSNSGVLGFRLGLDFDYYWGLEGRFAFTNPDTFVPGIPSVIGDSHNYYVDLNYMYYPWGDSRWKPYFSVGLGSGTYRFRDTTASVSDSGLRVPLAVGLKYLYSPWFALRFDAQLAPVFLSRNFDSQTEFMLSVGGEIRFGGQRKSYFPAHSGTIFW